MVTTVTTVSKSSSSEDIFEHNLCVCVCLYVFYGAYNCSGLVSQDLLLQMSYSRLLDLRSEESRVLRHVKPPRCGEATRKPRALRAGLKPESLVHKLTALPIKLPKRLCV